jgi:hypothetical protein
MDYINPEKIDFVEDPEKIKKIILKTDFREKCKLLRYRSKDGLIHFLELKFVRDITLKNIKTTEKQTKFIGSLASIFSWLR